MQSSLRFAVLAPLDIGDSWKLLLPLVRHNHCHFIPGLQRCTTHWVSHFWYFVPLCRCHWAENLTNKEDVEIKTIAGAQHFEVHSWQNLGFCDGLQLMLEQEWLQIPKVKSACNADHLALLDKKLHVDKIEYTEACSNVTENSQLIRLFNCELIFLTCLCVTVHHQRKQNCALCLAKQFFHMDVGITQRNQCNPSFSTCQQTSWTHPNPRIPHPTGPSDKQWKC